MLTLPAYHVAQAHELIARMQPELGRHAVTRRLTDIDHVGIAVADLEASVAEYRGSSGVEPTHRERVDDQGVEEVLFAVGSSFIQLLGALGPDTPVGQVPRRPEGPGLHHVAYRVDDVEGALAHLRDEGVRLIDEAPRAGSRNTLIAFVHPRAMGGVLVELVQDALTGLRSRSVRPSPGR